MKKEENIKVGISIGDLNGIGPEVVLKIFEDSRMLEFCTPIIFASIKTLSFVKKYYKLEVNLNGINDLNQALNSKVNVYNCWKENVNINFGKDDKKIGEYAIKSLEEATKALKNDQIDVLVTAPINKHNIQSDTFKFPGHTDYLNQELEGNSLMFMINDGLRVGLLTDHVPVKDVSKHITTKLIEDKINTVYTNFVFDLQ